MDYTAHGVAKSQQRLSGFRFHLMYPQGLAESMC